MPAPRVCDSQRPSHRPGDTFFVLIIFALLILQLLHSYYGFDLAYSPNAIANGQYWRLLSGHFTHTNLIHLALNLAVLVLLYLFVRPLGFTPLLLISLLPSALICSALFCFLSPELSWYYGFSGVLHGFALQCAIVMIAARDRSGGALLAIMATKIVWENSPWYTDSGLANLIDVRVATEAHLFGIVAALGLLIGYAVWRRITAH